ncbi:MAG: His/Gly/Thr/Pro-type tRNA ligase C-terminal domain-containing protein [Chloroflexota bacterium]
MRNAEQQKIPYMAIIGKRETENKKVALRKHGTGNIGTLTIQELIRKIAADQTR